MTNQAKRNFSPHSREERPHDLGELSKVTVAKLKLESNVQTPKSMLCSAQELPRTPMCM